MLLERISGNFSKFVLYEDYAEALLNGFPVVLTLDGRIWIGESDLGKLFDIPINIAGVVFTDLGEVAISTMRDHSGNLFCEALPLLVLICATQDKTSRALMLIYLLRDIQKQIMKIAGESLDTTDEDLLYLQMQLNLIEQSLN